MKTIIVDQFKGVSFVDVYVIDIDKNELLEIEQGMPISVMYQLIMKFKNDYGVTIAKFNEYDENEELRAVREILL